MILKSITLTGFKSFAKKTVIDISKNVTGIVGPNGSGKSNIAEAVRFVMGEQSMKSIRSKSMGDLVFKGSEHINQMSRASVSIEIDNKIKIYNDGISPELAAYLCYDQIILSREVFVDGGSVYKINNGEVRLKDVQSLLALAGIGASAHTIISQGEADKILISSSKDRKEMIEDALGLKIHQIRLKDSERKLKKVSEHMRTVELMRKEIAPELAHLKIQMEKINKIESEREKLLSCYLDYFAYESDDINKLKNRISSNKNLDSDIENKKAQLQVLKSKESELTDLESKSISDDKVSDKRKESIILSESRYEIERELSVMIYEKRNLLSRLEKEVTDITFNRKDFIDFKNKLKNEIEKINEILTAVKENSNTSISDVFLSVSNNIKDVLCFGDDIIKIDDVESNNKKINTEVSKLEESISLSMSNINKIKASIQDLDLKIKQEERDRLESVKMVYSNIFNIERDINKLEQDKRGMLSDMQDLQNRERDFIYKLEEGTKFVGSKILSYKLHNLSSPYSNYDNERLIERLKIRIEEIGILDPSSVKNSFEEISSRDLYLSSEIQDLKSTQNSLDQVVLKLENNIKNDFGVGVEKINFAFNNLFNEIFPGGRAGIKVEKSLVKDEDDQDTTEVVEGIMLEINLPSKKVSDINMLSGGEKTLASIALLFALTSITPPPFMVLDETDAALDEMNARKYGKLLSRLAEKSRLLVITHNRETMNECDILYGVTVGGDGSSKILSIKFD